MAAIMESMECRQHEQPGIYISFYQCVEKAEVISGNKGHAAERGWIVSINSFNSHFSPIERSVLCSAVDGYPQLSFNQSELNTGDSLSGRIGIGPGADHGGCFQPGGVPVFHSDCFHAAPFYFHAGPFIILKRY